MPTYYIPFTFLRHKDKLVWLTWSLSYVKEEMVTQTDRDVVDEYIQDNFIAKDNIELINFTPLGTKVVNSKDFFSIILEPNQFNLASALRYNALNFLQYILHNGGFESQDVISMAIDQSSNPSTIEFVMNYYQDYKVNKEDILRACDSDVGLDTFYYLSNYMNKKDVEEYVSAVGQDIGKLKVLKEFFKVSLRQKNIPLLLSNL